MDRYKELAEMLRLTRGNPGRITLAQGIVTKVEGELCDVKMGSLTVTDVRLRASEASRDDDMLVVPRSGSAVIVGSLSGDMSQLVVLAVDSIERIVINGGKLGGLVKIDLLTAKINELVKAFNTHVHTAPNGPTTAPTVPAAELKRADYEDENIKH